MTVHADPITFRRSPLADRAAELAASEVLIEEPFLPQFDVRTDATEVFGLRLPPPNRACGDERLALLWLAPDEWLVVGAEHAPTGHRSAVDVSASRTTLRLRGPSCRAALSTVCALDLHPRVFGPNQVAQTSIARVQTILWQLDDEPTYRLLVRNSFADHLATALLLALDATRRP